MAFAPLIPLLAGGLEGGAATVEGGTAVAAGVGAQTAGGFGLADAANVAVGGAGLLPGFGEKPKQPPPPLVPQIYDPMTGKVPGEVRTDLAGNPIDAWDRIIPIVNPERAMNADNQQMTQTMNGGGQVTQSQSVQGGGAAGYNSNTQVAGQAEQHMPNTAIQNRQTEVNQQGEPIAQTGPMGSQNAQQPGQNPQVTSQTGSQGAQPVEGSSPRNQPPSDAGVQGPQGQSDSINSPWNPAVQDTTQQDPTQQSAGQLGPAQQRGPNPDPGSQGSQRQQPQLSPTQIDPQTVGQIPASPMQVSPGSNPAGQPGTQPVPMQVSRGNNPAGTKRDIMEPHLASQQRPDLSSTTLVITSLFLVFSLVMLCYLAVRQRRREKWHSNTIRELSKVDEEAV